MASFQQVVRPVLAAGVPGELAFDGPLRVRPGIISLDAAPENCVFSRFFTLDDSTGEFSPGGALSDTVSLGGILGFPKEHPSFGVLGDPFAPSLNLAPGSNAAFIEMGMVWVICSTAADESNVVAYDNATGAIGAYINVAAIPGTSTQLKNASVYRSRSTVPGGIVCIKITE